jgi:carbon-monoxide dehydrogenase large subunit
MTDVSDQNAPAYRREDLRFITGKGRYTDDIDVPGQAYAAFVRSDHAHGIIRALEFTAAQEAPGVIRIVTGEDLLAGGVGFIRLLPFPGFDLGRATEIPRPGLAQGRVRYVGEPIAMIIAETAAQAADAALLIQADIEPLPQVTDVERALEKDAPQIWPEAAPGNVAFTWQSGDAAEIDRAFAAAPHVVELKLVNTRVFANPIEPRTCIASYDKASDRFEWITPSQGVEYMARVMCDYVFKIPDEKMTILTYDVGGAFGVKEQPYPEEIALLHGARLTGRTIKWRGTRGENLLSDNHARDAVIDCAMALDDDGNFLAVRADIKSAMGAYVSCNAAHASVRNTTYGLPQVYRTPLIHVAVAAVMTNTPSVGPYRGAGREQAAYIVERLVDEAARKLGVDRVALRRRNMIPAAAIPYRTPSGRLYDSGEFEAILDETLVKADWTGFAARERESRERGKISGQGISCFLECVGGTPYEGAYIRFGDDGRVRLVLATQSGGQGHETSFPQVVAQKLGIPYDSIEIVQGDSRDHPAGLATIGSRSMIMAGSALANTCDLVIEKGRQAAAHLLEAAATDIEFAHGEFRVAGTDRAIGLMEVAKRVRTLDRAPADCPTDLDSSGDYTAPDVHFPNGCHICEIEVDPQTGVVTVDRYVAVDDVGTVINPHIVHGQVHGGVAQGLGQVLMEHCQYDDSGQFVTASFMDYAMPRAHNLPSIEADFHPVPSPKNPLGVKGAGECGVTGSIPCLMNAIADALHRAGASPLIDMPVTPEKMWRALQTKATN